MVNGRKDCIDFVSIKNSNSFQTQTANLNCGNLIHLQCADLVPI